MKRATQRRKYLHNAREASQIFKVSGKQSHPVRLLCQGKKVLSPVVREPSAATPFMQMLLDLAHPALVERNVTLSLLPRRRLHDPSKSIVR